MEAQLGLQLASPDDGFPVPFWIVDKHIGLLRSG